MKRRDFMRRAGLAAAPFLTGLPKDYPATKAEIMTVEGPISARQLGRTLMHEHILVDFVGADKIHSGRYDRDEVVNKALPYLQQLAATGCRTLVDCTPAFLGRDPELLRRLSRESNLNILTNTGIYGAAGDKYVPHFAYSQSARQLSARWIREAEEGIVEGIRPGFMKIGVDSGPLSEIDSKLVTAAGLTHQRTGLVIASHTGDGVAALAQIDLLQSLGISPSSFIWVHAQNEPDQSVHKRAAELGSWVEFDGIAPQTIAQHVKLVMHMKSAGYLDRVLISQDAGWYHVGEPDGGTFHGYTTLFKDFLPALLAEGADPADIDTLLVRNPARALTPSI